MMDYRNKKLFIRKLFDMSVKHINSLKTIKEVEDYRKKMNEECDKRANMISVCTKANDLSLKDFGTIKECFEAISPELFKTKEGKAVMNKYISTIKSNKNLSSLHSLYENIRNVNADSDVDFFINEVAANDWGIDKKSVDNDCKKLGRVLAEGYILIGGNAVLPSENTRLAGAVKFISENKKTNKNIADYSNAVKVIREAVEKNEKVETVFESKNLEELAAELVEEFNKKYSSQLTEGEADALREVSNSIDRESVFEKYKKTCMDKLSEAKENFIKENNSAASEKLSAIMEQISNKTYSVETVGNDICGMIELTNIF